VVASSEDDPRDPLSRAFGQRVRDIREKQRMSRDRLSTDSGLSHRALDYLELGHRKPTLSTIIKLSRALGVTPGALVDGLVADEPV